MLPFHSGFFLLLSNDIIHTHNGFGLSVGLSPSVPILFLPNTIHVIICTRPFPALLYYKR